MSVKGNSPATTSPTLDAVIDGVIGRIVLEKLLDGQPLPLQVFPIAADQVWDVALQTQLVRERQP